jgi:tRNA (cytidine/uridine-2'-O-)-methyltransferase
LFKVVLFQPQIPPNTGNIGRICVNSGAELHLVKPLGFSLEEKHLKRAGLDYWEKLSPTIWENQWEFLRSAPIEKCHFATTKGEKYYFETRFQPGDFLIFGKETAGIDSQVLEMFPNRTIKIPMVPEGRSLNLAVSVGIVLYEAIRQNFDQWRRDYGYQ